MVEYALTLTFDQQNYTENSCDDVTKSSNKQNEIITFNRIYSPTQNETGYDLKNVNTTQPVAKFKI